MIGSLLQDLRFAWRLAVRQPWLSTAAVLTLALGIGSTTALFSVVHAWLLTPLPYRQPERLVVVWETIPSASIFENTPAPASLNVWRARARSFEALAPWTLAVVNLTGDGDPLRLTAARASSDLLPLLGVTPILGRNFTSEEAQPNGPAVAILTHGLWTTRFGGSADVVGQRIMLSGTPTTVVGVLPRDVRLLDLSVDLWQPIRLTAGEAASENRILWVIGRLARDVPVARASDEVDALMRERSRGLGARVVPLHEQTVGALGRDVVILFGATGFVLLIACANVASLALARITGRRQEIVVRTALGAGRRRLVRQVLTESVGLGLIGGGVGLLLAAWTVRAVIALTPGAGTLPDVPPASPWAFLFAFAAATLTAVLFGLAPAWQAAGAQIGSAMREGSHTLAGGRRWLLRAVVTAEVALALALLVGAGLVTRSYRNLAAVDLGFRPDGAIAFQVPRPSTESPQASVAFYDELLQRLREAPGVRSAALIQALPLRSSAMGSNFVVEGRTGDGSSILSYWRVISDGYFETLGIRRVEGRAFDRRDREGAPGVAIVTESFARRAWPGGGAVGRRIGWATLDQPLIVVGVVSDIRVSPAAAPAPHVYMPFAQVPERLPQDLVVRADAAPAAAIDAVRRTIWSLDPRQPVAGIATFETLLERSMGRRRFQLTLLTLFAGIAASLALIGIYGVLSYVVGQMSAELGIRLALGASPGRLVWVVMRMGLSTAGTGIAIGIVLAVWSAGLLRGFLFGVDARDPMTYAVVAGLLLLAAATACLLPARRAAIVDPLRALRSP